MNISKITLGTAQLGMNYGIANVSGKPNFKKALRLLKYAWKNGINSFDTAPEYGNSEQVLGSFISSELNNEFDEITIISKFPKIKIRDNLSFNNIYNEIKKQIDSSLDKLKIDKISIYLLHNAEDLFLNNGIIVDCLSELKKEGIIERFGLSIYNPKDVENSLKFKEIDVIQIPINIFDHRLISSGLLNRLKNKKYLIFARSIYLQGLFFLTLNQLIEKKLEFAKEPLLKLHNLSNEFKIDIDKLAFLFIRDIQEISSMVIGMERIEQISKNIELLKENSLSLEIQKRLKKEFVDMPEKIINPSLWLL